MNLQYSNNDGNDPDDYDDNSNDNNSSSIGNKKNNNDDDDDDGDAFVNVANDAYTALSLGIRIQSKRAHIPAVHVLTRNNTSHSHGREL